MQRVRHRSEQGLRRRQAQLRPLSEVLARAGKSRSGLPCSLGLGPTSAPPSWLPSSRCRAQPGASPGHPRRAGTPAGRSAAWSTSRRRATRLACVGMSCRSSPARRAPRATGRGCAARTEPRPGRTIRGSRPPVFRLRPLGRQQRLDCQPEVVRDKGAPLYNASNTVSPAALSLLSSRLRVAAPLPAAPPYTRSPAAPAGSPYPPARRSARRAAPRSGARGS